jgi:ABC-2 type transport system permease protein
VLSKGIEFVASIPVLAIFALLMVFTDHPATLHWEAIWWIPAIILQSMLTLGIGLIVAPLVVFFRDLERAVKLALRFLFYASPIIYGLSDLPSTPVDLHFWAAFNPLSGIFGMYRAAFFPGELDPFAMIVAALMSIAFLVIGLLVFRGSIRTVLKEM